MISKNLFSVRMVRIAQGVAGKWLACEASEGEAARAEIYTSARRALSAIKRQDSRFSSRNNLSRVTRIEWIPRTAAGREEVELLSATGPVTS